MRRRSRGEGTLVKRRDGRWCGALRLGGVRRWVYGKTRAEVAHKLDTLRRQAQGGLLPDPGGRTVGDLLDAWLEAVRGTLQPATVAAYEQVIRLYITPALGGVRLTRLTPAHIQRLYSDLSARGLKRQPAKVHAVLRRAFRLAVRWGWAGADPTARVVAPGYRPEERRLWTPEELRAFLAGAQGHRFYPLYVLLLASGLRLGEALGLKWDDIDWTRSTVTVRRSLRTVGGQRVEGRPKTKSGERVVVVPYAVLALLRQAQGGGGGEWVFETTHTAAERALGRLCAALSLRPMTPHGLRHLHASLLLAGGLGLPDVSRRLGHANTQVTAAVYSHALPGRDREAAVLLEATLQGGEL